MSMIWYNPEAKEYQKGQREEYESLKKSSPIGSSFHVVFEFNPTSERLIDKVFNALINNRSQTKLSYVNS